MNSSPTSEQPSTPTPPINDKERPQGVLIELAIDALIGIFASASAAVARILLEQITGGVAPFILTFPAVMIATLASGGRAGAFAIVGCQTLTVLFVFPHWLETRGGVFTDITNLILSTAAMAGTVWATASYRHTSRLLRSHCERELDTMKLLISEVNRRAKNNLEMTGGMLMHQAAVSNAGAAAELEKAASRLDAVASIYENLSFGETKYDRVDLAQYLERIIVALRVGAAPEHVVITYEADNVTVSMHTAVIVGLVTNEWITGALKVAVGRKPGSIAVRIRQDAPSIEVSVVTDVDVPAAPARSDREPAMIDLLTRSISGRMHVSRSNGTSYRLTFRNTKDDEKN